MREAGFGDHNRGLDRIDAFRDTMRDETKSSAMDTRRAQLDALTEQVIGCAFNVANELGKGFLEKVYENALAHELRKGGLKLQQQFAIQVKYDEIVVGEFVADILVEGQVLIGLKAIKALEESHVAKCTNYLKATGLSVCLLMNFGESRVKVRRIVNRF